MRWLSNPPTIIDLGDGSGTYAAWLVPAEYIVHLVDATPRLVEIAKRVFAGQHVETNAMAEANDARSLT